jgi:amino acid adenylation domain-containing protein
MNAYLLHQLLEESAARHPGKDAVVDAVSSLTYGDLERQSSRLAGFLHASGVRKGDRVGLLLGKSIESIVGMFGILKAGAAYVPLDPALPAGRIAHIVDRCEIDLLIVKPSTRSRADDIAAAGSRFPSKILVMDQFENRSADDDPSSDCFRWQDVNEAPPAARMPEGFSDRSPAYILHTSGSTGFPKGVLISHRNALSFVLMASDFFSIDGNDRLGNHAPHHFDLSMFDIFVGIHKGATIVIVPDAMSVFPVKMAEYIDNKKITVWNSVSSVLSMLASRCHFENLRFDSLRLVLFSGEVLPIKHLRRWKSHLPHTAFFNIYGQTEANSSTFHQIVDLPEDDGGITPIGRPFPNFEVFALNDHGKEIGPGGEEGELYVSGSTVAIGYWRDREKTDERFIPDPRVQYHPPIVYKTGDRVRYAEDGNLILLGRTDHLIKSRGFRIELSEIESVLSRHPAVSQAVVIPIPDDEIGNRLFAFVIGRKTELARLTDTVVFKHCNENLPKYMVPERIFILEDDFPRTVNGKVDRTFLSTQIKENI